MSQPIQAKQPDNRMSKISGSIKQGVDGATGIVKKGTAGALALSGKVATKIKETVGDAKKSVSNTLANSSEIKKKIKEEVADVKKRTLDASVKIKKNMKLSALALRIVLTNKEIQDEIAGAVKSVTDISKKSVEEARDQIVKDKVFLNNLTNTTRKIGDQLSQTLYSTINGISLGAVSDVQAIYSSFSATLNAFDLLSSIVKIPITKLDEKIKGDSKEVISLFQSLISIKNNYYATMKKLNDDANNSMKLAQASLSAPALPVPAMPVPALPVPALPVPAMPVPALPVPAMPVPAIFPPLSRSGGSSYKKKKTKRVRAKRIRNRTRKFPSYMIR